MRRSAWRVTTLFAVVVGALLATLVHAVPASAAVSPAAAVWFNPSSGVVSLWLLDNAGATLATQNLANTCGTAGNCSAIWKPLAMVDMDRDDHLDIVWYDASSGVVSEWLLDGSGGRTGIQNLTNTCGAANGCSAEWKPVGLADMNGDGHRDVLWYDANGGVVSTWLLAGGGAMNGIQNVADTCGAAGGCSAVWRPVGPADLNGDGRQDFTWYDPNSGIVSTWLLDNAGGMSGIQNLTSRCGASGGCSTNWRLIDLAE
jgi:VCBS repeat protein